MTIETVKSIEKSQQIQAKSKTDNSDKQISTDNYKDKQNVDVPEDDRQHKTLITGSSILKGINTKGLNQTVHVKTHPGATVKSLHEILSQSDLTIYKTVIIHVGGNDAANSNTDPDQFRSEFSSLISDLNSNVDVIVSGLLPRGDVDLHPFNDIVRELCLDKSIRYIDNYPSFLLTSGEQPKVYYFNDLIHLKDAGTAVLLRNINAVTPILKTSTKAYNSKTVSNRLSNNHYNKPQTQEPHWSHRVNDHPKQYKTDRPFTKDRRQRYDNYRSPYFHNRHEKLSWKHKRNSYNTSRHSYGDNRSRRTYGHRGENSQDSLDRHTDTDYFMYGGQERTDRDDRHGLHRRRLSCSSIDSYYQ